MQIFLSARSRETILKQRKLRGSIAPPHLFVPGPVPFLFFLLLAVLLSVAGCAKIADPQPPEILVPTAAVDLTVRQRADTVVLRVSIPRQNTNGSPVRTLQCVEVYRHASDVSEIKHTLPISVDRFQREAVQILSIPEARITDYGHEDLLVIEDRFPGLEPSTIYSHTFRYAVRFVNNKNQAAGFSNQAVISPVRMPPPPSGLSAKVTETSIDLQWNASLENFNKSGSNRTAGYNLYRSMEQGHVPSTPVNSLPLKNPEFKDVHFDFDRTYYYRASVIGGSPETPAESFLSEEFSVTPRDVFPPLSARNFNVLFEGGFNLLLWNPSLSTDVAGYRITRHEEETNAEQPLRQGLITGNSYRDININAGKKYVYTLTAIDAHGNVSPAVQATVTSR